MTDGLTFWQPRNTASHAQLRVTRSASCYPNSTMRPRSPYRQRMMLTDLTDHHVAGAERQLKPNTRPPRLAVKARMKQLGVVHMTFGRTWTVKQDTQDRSTNREDVP